MRIIGLNMKVFGSNIVIVTATWMTLWGFVVEGV